MADNIVNSLFGVDPQQLAQQRQEADFVKAYKFAQLDPLEQAKMSIYQGGMGVGRGVNGLLGGDAELQKTTALRQLAGQFNTTTPEGLRQFAMAARQIAPQEAFMASKRADELEAGGLNLQKTKADISLSERKVSQDEKLREALAALPENATDAQYLQVFRQFGSPDQQAKAIEMSMSRKAKAAGDGTMVGTAGPVGKAGAYRDIDGTVFGVTEMKNVRSEFTEGQKLLDSLNKVTAQDLKDAESYVDWTTAGVTKGFASSKTLSAQTKLAASQLVEQINSLPPGSASDADMRAAMKSFPGYTDPEALRLWVNRTKDKLQSRLGDISTQFNFKQKITSSGDLTFSKGKQPVKINTQPAQGGGVIKLD